MAVAMECNRFRMLEGSGLRGSCARKDEVRGACRVAGHKALDQHRKGPSFQLR
jgi:hypothetical protein